MATIKEVKEVKKKDGKKTWVYVMDDGTEGFGHKDNPDKPWEYKVGDQVTYSVEDKGGYKVLKFVRTGTPTPAPTPNKPVEAPKRSIEPLSPPSGGITVQDVFREKNALLRTLFEIVIGAHLDGKITMEKAGEEFKKWSEIGDSRVDELATKS